MMSSDIRTPLGMIFLIIGMLLAGYGVSTRGDVIYAASDGVNLNLIWGCVMAVFGAIMLLLGRKGRLGRTRNGRSKEQA